MAIAHLTMIDNGFQDLFNLIFLFLKVKNKKRETS